jgi:hypothetical protein
MTDPARSELVNSLAGLRQLMTAPPGIRVGNTTLIKPPNPPASTPYVFTNSSDYWVRITAATFTLATLANQGAVRNTCPQWADADGFVYAQSPSYETLQDGMTVPWFGALQQPAAIGPTYPVVEGSTQLQNGQPLVTNIQEGESLTGFDLSGLPPTAPSTTTVQITNTLGGVLTWAWPQPVAGPQPLIVRFPGPIPPLNATTPITFTVTSAATVGNFALNTYGAFVPPFSFGIMGPMPDVILKPGHTWTTFIQGMVAGDQISNVGLLLERYPSDFASGARAANEEAVISQYLATHGG